MTWQTQIAGECFASLVQRCGAEYPFGLKDPMRNGIGVRGGGNRCVTLRRVQSLVNPDSSPPAVIAEGRGHSDSDCVFDHRFMT